MMLIRIFLLIILLTGLPEVFEFGFRAYSNNAQPPMSDRRGSIRSRSPGQSRPPLTGRRKPLQRSIRSKNLPKEGFEVGLILGTAHSLTNICTGKASFMGTHWETTDLNTGVFGRYRLDDKWAVNSSFHYARIHSADSLSPENTSRYHRGFYFENQIFELSVTGEFYVSSLIDRLPLEIFGYLGAGIFYHNPQLTVPPDTEMPDDEYSLIQPAIPMGIGIRYPINENFVIGFDIGHRMTFTDYIDGFTRPASDYDDSYFLGSLRISYFFSSHGRFRPY